MALHLAGEERVVRERDAQTEKWFSILHGLYSEQKASFKILSIKLPTYSFRLHLNKNEDHYSTSKLKSLLWFCLSLSPPLSSLISLCWYLHVNHFCLSAFLSFFPHSIYMSVASAAWWRCVAMKVICSVTVRPFYQLLLSSILVREYWWQWNQGAVKTFCKLLCQWRWYGFHVATVLFHSPVEEVQHLCPFLLVLVKLCSHSKSLCKLTSLAWGVCWTILYSDFILVLVAFGIAVLSVHYTPSKLLW